MARGAVLPQYKRCGKGGCRCARGDLHGPYWYLFYRQEGRLVKTYLRPGEVEAVRAACREWRELQTALLRNRRETMGLFQRMRQMLREMGGDG